MSGHPLPAGVYRKRGMVTIDIFTGSDNSVRVGPFDGDITITDAFHAKYQEPVVMDDRDVYAGALMGKDIYPEGSLTIRHKGKLSESEVRSIKDCICYAGAFADDSYTDPLGDMPSHKIVVTIKARDGVDVATMPNTHAKGDYSSGEVNTLPLSWTCYRPQVGGDPDSAENQPITWE
jgi:hypothetical protein